MREPLIIRVETRLVGEEEMESVDYLDQNDPGGRTWLAKHAWWAMRSGRAMTTFAVESADAPLRRYRP